MGVCIFTQLHNPNITWPVSLQHQVPFSYLIVVMWQPDSRYLTFWQPDLIVKSDQMLTIHDSCQKNPATAVFEAKKLRQKNAYFTTFAFTRRKCVNGCRTHRVPTYPWYFPSSPSSRTGRRFLFQKPDLAYSSLRVPSTHTFSESS